MHKSSYRNSFPLRALRRLAQFWGLFLFIYFIVDLGQPCRFGTWDSHVDLGQPRPHLRMNNCRLADGDKGVEPFV